MKAELVFVTPNDHAVFQMQDGTIAEFSTTPKMGLQTTLHKLLKDEPKVHIHIETMDGIRLTGGSAKGGSGFSVKAALVVFGLLLGAGICALVQSYFQIM